MNSNRIEKEVLLRTTLDRVWNALVNSDEFGTWFGMKFTEPFAEGKQLRGTLTPTKVNAEVAAMQKPHKGLTFDIVVESIKPRHLFSFRWHPHAVDPGVDYSSEPTTLVEFIVEEVDDGIKLRVVESGFENIPLARRATAFSANEGGWSVVINLVADYLAQTA